jgi:aldose 1-epimerase
MSISQKTIAVNDIVVEEFTIRNESNNMVLTMVSYGATITSCRVGEFQEEVTLCYPLERLVNEPGPYFGATVGRVANRICGGKFQLDTEDGRSNTYTLAVNNGTNHLHGGVVGFDKKNWDFELIDNSEHIGVKFKCISEAEEEGILLRKSEQN